MLRVGKERIYDERKFVSYRENIPEKTVKGVDGFRM